MLHNKAPRHDRNTPHSRIQGVPPAATNLGKFPIKPRETSAKQISDVRQIARGGWPTRGGGDFQGYPGISLIYVHTCLDFIFHLKLDFVVFYMFFEILRQKYVGIEKKHQ